MPKRPGRPPQRPRRRSTAIYYWAVVIIGAVILFSIPHLGGTANAKPIFLKQATTVGKSVLPMGDTTHGGHGQTVDGISCAAMEKVTYHVHAHLSLIVNSSIAGIFPQHQQIAIPAGIGIVPPRTVQNHFVTGGKCFYWLHTHDATGIIHVEAPKQGKYTLGQFFKIWGRTLSRSDVAGYDGKVTALVDGQVYKGKLADIELTAHKEITLEVGSPLQKNPPQYVFPPGL